MGSFQNKNIIITGGSTGIGFCMARELAQRGANLVLIARDKARLEAAQSELSTQGGNVQIFSCDVTDAAQLKSCIDEACTRLGSLDGLIANSGYCHPGYFHEISTDDLFRQVNTNLMGGIYALHAAIPHLIQNKGGFIAITSSPAGNAGIFGFSAYGATKAALNNLAHVLRCEYQRYAINVHVLLPPDTNTPGYAHEITLYPDETRAILAGGRLHEPDTVARRFIEGIARNKKQIGIGLETHLLLFLVRHFPWIWEGYVRKKSRHV